MSTVITVENLGKKYTLHHQQREQYTAMRDVIAESVKGAGRRVASLFSHSPFTLHPSPFTLHRLLKTFGHSRRSLSRSIKGTGSGSLGGTERVAWGQASMLTSCLFWRKVIRDKECTHSATNGSIKMSYLGKSGLRINRFSMALMAAFVIEMPFS